MFLFSSILAVMVTCGRKKAGEQQHVFSGGFFLPAVLGGELRDLAFSTAVLFNTDFNFLHHTLTFPIVVGKFIQLEAYEEC